MRKTMLTAALAAALAGCGSDDARRDTVTDSLKRVLRDAGMGSPSFRSSSGDGRSEVVLSGFTATLEGGVTLSADRVRVVRPDYAPLMDRWHEFGPVVIGGYEIYGAPDPKPFGFSAAALRFEGITVAEEDSEGALKADHVEVHGFDGTRRRQARYNAYEIGGIRLEHSGGEIFRIDQVSGTAGNWIDDLSMHLDASFHMNGSAGLGHYGAFLPLVGLPGGSELQFSAKVESTTDPVTGDHESSVDLDLGQFGTVSFSFSLGGFTADTLKDMAQAVTAARQAGADEDGEETNAAIVEIITQKATLKDVTFEGRKLEWTGTAFDLISGGDRESLVEEIIQASNSEFGAAGRDKGADRIVTGIVVFIRNPSTFLLEIRPEAPLPLSEIAAIIDGAEEGAESQGDAAERLGITFTANHTQP